MTADGVLVPGVKVGHWTSPTGATGTTVVVPDEPAVGAVDIRGLAPATRETEALAPWRLVERVDAVVLSGGSVFGLGTAHTVASGLAEAGRGFPTAAGPVPIVPAACVFDLVVSGGEFPPPEAGAAALSAASTEPSWGRIGAGAGASVGKHLGGRWSVPGGIGAARADVTAGAVSAIAVVNAFGDVVAEDGTVLAGSRAEGEARTDPFGPGSDGTGEDGSAGNTTLAVVLTTVPLQRTDALGLSIAAHDGIARSLRPSHSRYDGDAVFVLAVPAADSEPAARAEVDSVMHVVADVVARAVRHGVTMARLPRPEAGD